MNALPYAVWKVGETEYKLKLTTQATVEAEQKLGKSLVSAATDLASVRLQLLVLTAALQKYHHGITQSDAINLYDEYLDNGGTIEELAELVVEVFEVSGFMKKGTTEQIRAGNVAP